MKRNNADIKYWAFRKAFDTVSHNRLLVKMINVDISKKKNSKHYKRSLIDRAMKIQIGNYYSKTQNIPSDIPQGSVLGPLLFMIFLNNFCQLC